MCVLCTRVYVCRDYECLCSHPRPASHCQASHTLSAVSLPSPTPTPLCVHGIPSAGTHCTGLEFAQDLSLEVSKHDPPLLESTSMDIFTKQMPHRISAPPRCRTSSPLNPTAPVGYAVGRAIYCSRLACSDPSRWGSIWCADSLKHGAATLFQSSGRPRFLASSRNAHTCERTQHPKSESTQHVHVQALHNRLQTRGTHAGAVCHAGPFGFRARARAGAATRGTCTWHQVGTARRGELHRE